jgi:hypothetical protein
LLLIQRTQILFKRVLELHVCIDCGDHLGSLIHPKHVVPARDLILKEQHHELRITRIQSARRLPSSAQHACAIDHDTGSICNQTGIVPPVSKPARPLSHSRGGSFLFCCRSFDLLSRLLLALVTAY